MIRKKEHLMKVPLVLKQDRFVNYYLNVGVVNDKCFKDLKKDFITNHKPKSRIIYITGLCLHYLLYDVEILICGVNELITDSIQRRSVLLELIYNHYSYMREILTVTFMDELSGFDEFLEKRNIFTEKHEILINKATDFHEYLYSYLLSNSNKLNISNIGTLPRLNVLKVNVVYECLMLPYITRMDIKTMKNHFEKMFSTVERRCMCRIHVISNRFIFKSGNYYLIEIIYDVLRGSHVCCLYLLRSLYRQEYKKHELINVKSIKWMSSNTYKCEGNSSLSKDLTMFIYNSEFYKVCSGDATLESNLSSTEMDPTLANISTIRNQTNEEGHFSTGIVEEVDMLTDLQECTISNPNIHHDSDTHNKSETIDNLAATQSTWKIKLNLVNLFGNLMSPITRKLVRFLSQNEIFESNSNLYDNLQNKLNKKEGNENQSVRRCLSISKSNGNVCNANRNQNLNDYTFKRLARHREYLSIYMENKEKRIRKNSDQLKLLTERVRRFRQAEQSKSRKCWNSQRVDASESVFTETNKRNAFFVYNHKAAMGDYKARAPPLRKRNISRLSSSKCKSLTDVIERKSKVRSNKKREADSTYHMEKSPIKSSTRHVKSDRLYQNGDASMTNSCENIRSEIFDQIESDFEPEIDDIIKRSSTSEMEFDSVSFQSQMEILKQSLGTNFESSKFDKYHMLLLDLEPCNSVFRYLSIYMVNLKTNPLRYLKVMNYNRLICDVILDLRLLAHLETNFIRNIFLSHCRKLIEFIATLKNNAFRLVKSLNIRSIILHILKISKETGKLDMDVEAKVNLANALCLLDESSLQEMDKNIAKTSSASHLEWQPFTGVKILYHSFLIKNKEHYDRLKNTVFSQERIQKLQDRYKCQICTGKYDFSSSCCIFEIYYDQMIDVHFALIEELHELCEYQLSMHGYDVFEPCKTVGLNYVFGGLMLKEVNWLNSYAKPSEFEGNEPFYCF